METTPSSAHPREQDSGTWWYLIHTKVYRYRALLRTYWWLVLLTTCLGLAIAAWKTAHQPVVYASTGRMMVSGKINLQEGATYTEEMNLFMSTQREMMQDEAVRQRATELLDAERASFCDERLALREYDASLKQREERVRQWEARVAAQEQQLLAVGQQWLQHLAELHVGPFALGPPFLAVVPIAGEQAGEAHGRL